MKKSNMIVATILGILIIILIIMLSIAPLMKKDIEKEPEEIKDIVNNEEEINNIATIQLGVNHLITGSGAEVRSNDIYITEPGTYTISGTLVEGTIFIETNNNVTLNLDGVDIRTSKSALEIKENIELTINLTNTNFINAQGINTNSNINVNGIGTLNMNLTTGIKAAKLSFNSGNITINSDTLFNATNDIAINGGTLIALSNSNIKVSSSSNQKSLMLALDETINENENLSLINDNDQEIVNFTTLKNIKNILISAPNLIDGKYHLYKLNNDKKERVVINITDTFIVDKINNLYGNL